MAYPSENSSSSDDGVVLLSEDLLAEILGMNKMLQGTVDNYNDLHSCAHYTYLNGDIHSDKFVMFQRQVLVNLENLLQMIFFSI